VLTPCEISRLATDVATVQTDTITLTRATSASDGLGGRTNTFTTVATYAARVSPVSTQQAEEEIGAVRLKDGMYYRISLPAGTDIRTGDRVNYGSLVLSVEAVMSPGTLEIERKAFAVRAAR
jgi:SPP1 family predicted phage head-tail adaptor